MRHAERKGFCCDAIGVRWKRGRWRYCSCPVGIRMALADVRHAQLEAAGLKNLANTVARETINEGDRNG